jgi:Rrf2 family protein
MLTATSEYALRAVSLLARADSDGMLSAMRIAEETDVPRKYLSAILSELVRAGVLESAPGPNGGFRLVRPPGQLPLNAVLEPFEPILWKRRPCPFGQSTCSDDDACGGHERWKKVREAYLEFLHQTTVLDVAAKPEVDANSAPSIVGRERARSSERSR